MNDLNPSEAMKDRLRRIRIELDGEGDVEELAKRLGIPAGT